MFKCFLRICSLIIVWYNVIFVEEILCMENMNKG